MDINITQHVEQLGGWAVAAIGGAVLGWKKLQKVYARDDLDTNRATTESNYLTMIFERLKELETINKGLVLELETMRQENMEAKLQNKEMRTEIQKLRQFIEQNFTPTYS